MKIQKIFSIKVYKIRVNSKALMTKNQYIKLQNLKIQRFNSLKNRSKSLNTYRLQNINLPKKIRLLIIISKKEQNNKPNKVHGTQTIL